MFSIGASIIIIGPWSSNSKIGLPPTTLFPLLFSGHLNLPLLQIRRSLFVFSWVILLLIFSKSKGVLPWTTKASSGVNGISCLNVYHAALSSTFSASLALMSNAAPSVSDIPVFLSKNPWYTLLAGTKNLLRLYSSALYHICIKSSESCDILFDVPPMIGQPYWCAPSLKHSSFAKYTCFRFITSPASSTIHHVNDVPRKVSGFSIRRK